jgi:hypothetical protein
MKLRNNAQSREGDGTHDLGELKEGSEGTTLWRATRAAGRGTYNFPGRKLRQTQAVRAITPYYCANFLTCPSDELESRRYLRSDLLDSNVAHSRAEKQHISDKCEVIRPTHSEVFDEVKSSSQQATCRNAPHPIGRPALAAPAIAVTACP